VVRQVHVVTDCLDLLAPLEPALEPFTLSGLLRRQDGLKIEVLAAGLEVWAGIKRGWTPLGNVLPRATLVQVHGRLLAAVTFEIEGPA
jgi:hypothetical protein